MLRNLQKMLSRVFADRHHLRVKKLKKEVGGLQDHIAYRMSIINRIREVRAGNKVRMYILAPYCMK